MRIAALVICLVSLSAAGCGPAATGGDDDDAPGGDAGGTATCGFCQGSKFVGCDAARQPTAAVECDPDMCVPGRGCLPCSPGTAVCVGEEIHACGADGHPAETLRVCDPGVGETCSRGSCKTPCEAASAEASNVGCDFWAVDLDNEYSQFNDAAAAPWGIVLSNTGKTNARVTIERNDAPAGQPLQTAVVQTLMVAPGSLEKVILPTREVDGSTGRGDGPGTFLSSNAYRIKSTSPLVVYQFNAMASIYSNDASLLIPENGLGTQYRVIGWPTANPISIGLMVPGIPDHSFVTIVGTQPNTAVTITAGGKVVGGGPMMTTPVGGEIRMTIGPFDVINVESDGIPGDLSGTLVRATAPVAVFTGGERGIAPMDDRADPPPSYDTERGHCCTDHLEEQLFPLTSLGRRFAVTRSPIRSTQGWVEPDIVRFVGAASPATVTTTLPAPNDTFQLSPGQVRDLYTKVDFIAEATEPVLLAQILVSQGFCEAPAHGGDPSLTVFPPVEQYRSDYLFLVPPSWDANYVVIAMKDGSEVKIDGQPLPASCITATIGNLGGDRYIAKRCPIAAGAHRLTGATGIESGAPPAKFGVVAYGYGSVGSYAFTGGSDVKRIDEPPPLL